MGGEDLWLINEPKRGIGKMPLNLAYFGIITRKSPEIVRFQDFLVEISGNELLLFVCLKDSQGKEKTPTFRLELVETSGIEPLLFVCLKDSQKSWIKQKTNLSVGLGGDKRDRTADLLNAIQALSQLSYTPIFGCCQTTSVL